MMQSIRDIFRSYAVLDADGRHTNGTDKESNHHYGDAYEQLLPSRLSVNLMMEIGVADGSSLRAWRDIFPNALCVGMDIHHSDRAHGERIEFRIGDATKQRDCEDAAAGRMFDVIVEDAAHHPGESLLTLMYLWPFVRPGGLYVMEEFYNVTSLRKNIIQLWPFAEIIGTCGPHIEDEPLVVFRKPT